MVQAKKKATGDLFAIKVMRKADLIRKNMVQSVKNERNILAMANNPFVVRQHHVATRSLPLRSNCSFLACRGLRCGGRRELCRSDVAAQRACAADVRHRASSLRPHVYSHSCDFSNCCYYQL